MSLLVPQAPPSQNFGALILCACVELCPLRAQSQYEGEALYASRSQLPNQKNFRTSPSKGDPHPATPADPCNSKKPLKQHDINQ